MTEQINKWKSEFGDEYIQRNLFKPEEIDNLYLSRYGISRISMNEMFLNFLDRNVKILEVGTNIGLQLNLLSKVGFQNLYGIEVNPFAIKTSQGLNEGLPIYIIEASAFDIPFNYKIGSI